MEQLVLDLMREALMIIIKVSLPILLTGLTIGLVVSIFQTATSIQEQTLAFIPKIIGTFLAIILFGSWIMTMLVNFATKIFTSFNTYL
ncbi:flagellar biosynthesis protein FliQ [Cellulosilyticum sp. I15G10I2]|uniref:flagellar biosynthesis protein FliQ n=1 Tax=Cellulosilyticum sp. I15G10I2 TaxID=1892843 RepID=UPI00085BD27E|nr:flagellar biosynthesis protein FliQ [Cellulosilyticum sp. I15G10I2]